MVRGSLLEQMDMAGALEDVDQIAAHCQAALLDTESVEVFLNDDKKNIFTTLLMDHTPDDEGSSYRPTFYLRDKEYILISPMEPATGNALIRRAESIRIRFHDGTIRLEALVQFLGVLQVKGKPAIKLSFPSKVVKVVHRKTLRAKVVDGMVVKVIVTRPGYPPVESDALDLSLTGISIYYPKEMEEVLEDGRKVNLEIKTPDMPGSIKLGGFVRNKAKSRDAEDVFKSRQKCGIQYEKVFGKTLVQQMEKLVTRVEKRHKTFMQRQKMQFMSGGD